MAIATVAVFNRPSPRHAAAASAPRVPPRVYTPYSTRRLTRPMAVPPGAPGAARPRFAFLRGRRNRSS